MLPTRDPPQDKRPIQTGSEGFGKKYSKERDRKKKTRVAKLTSDKIGFKTKAIKKTKKVTS